MSFPYSFPIGLTWLNELLNEQPRPGISFSYSANAPEIEIPKSSTNKLQHVGSPGRELTFNGEVWADSDVDHLLSLIQSDTSPTIHVPELQEEMKVVPLDVSITEEVGQKNRHHFELTLGETV